jgi:hypothetical protein
MASSKTFAAALALAAATALSSACVTMQVPKDFLVVADGDQLKAITPDEVKLWVRDFEDPDRGELAFWQEALKNDFVENRGYVLIEEAPIKDGVGTAGASFVFETTLQGRPTRELVAVFVYDDLFAGRVRVVELVAERARFDEVVGEVRAAIATLE